MSNCKEIALEGTMPFNSYQHEGLNKMLGQLNAPCFGFRIEYHGQAGSVPNSHGGKTAMYKFSVTGVEAVSDHWVAHFIRNVRKAGGTADKFRLLDIENNALISFDSIATIIKAQEREGK